LAAAPARDVADDALLRWAHAEHERGDCPAALGLYGAVERRGDDETLAAASQGVASCRTAVGILALEDREFSVALRSFEAAIKRDPEGPSGRRALVGLGDVHYQLGELYQAQLAWRTAASTAGAQDSITTLALERLRASEVVEEIPEPETP
ncbi:MAG TPA: tetratricopeptide repeat protein, partial [Gemmatimonadales bacterium]|nr:tetratricopeptide repeat protein [Gemmatimonadales bacterium]